MLIKCKHIGENHIKIGLQKVPNKKSFYIQRMQQMHMINKYSNMDIDR